MRQLPDFKLEAHFSRWEFKATHHLTASDAQTLSLSELLSMACPEDREEFETMSLGYTQTYGEPELRDAIASIYKSMVADDILCFAGASEGIFAANACILDSTSHAITVIPNYQSHETLPASIGSVTGVALNPDEGWNLDIDLIAAAIRPNTRLITINFPHNPTGAILGLDKYMDLIDLCRQSGIYVLHDEIFHGLGPTACQHLPHIADLYEKGLSLNVMSKSYGLPGLRIGWIACRDRKLLSRMERTKHYLSICNSGPSEKLAKIALKNGRRILKRNCAIVDKNLLLWEEFFARFPDLFDWTRPDGSCIGFPRYLGEDGVESFCRNLVEGAGILVLPSSIYASTLGETPKDRFRIGYGRHDLSDGLGVMGDFIERRYM